MKKVVIVFLCCMVFLAFEARGTWAEQFCVNNAAVLQADLTTASSNGEDNVIMVVQGTYTGNFTYNSSFGKSITLQGGYTKGCVSQVFNPAKTVLDGNHAGIVLSLYDSNGGNISVEEFTIRNGNTTGSGGGGVYAESDSNSSTAGTITLSGNTFAGNTGSEGGGVYAQSYSNSGTGGTITLTGNTFTGNYAYEGGGGVYAYSYSSSGAGGPITFMWNTFTGNTANQGGGVLAESSGVTGSGQIYFYENTFTGNYGYGEGGGVTASSSSTSGTGGDISLTGNTFTGNYAYNQGGGVLAQSQVTGTGTGGVISLVGNTITGNYGYNGAGGVLAESFSQSSGTGGVISLMGNTITGNYVYDGEGGGVYAESYSNSGTSGAITMTQNTISGNTAYAEVFGGAGVYISMSSSSGTGGFVTLTGNTIANNHAVVGSGGGVYCDITTDTGATNTITFDLNTITGNTASPGFGWGGGVYANAYSYSSGTIGPIVFANNIIAANTSYFDGAVFASSSSSSGMTYAIIFTNNTITKNSGLNGGGVEVSMSNNELYFYNNIIWGNTGGDISLSGTGTAYGYNNDYNVISGSWNGGSAGNIDLPPLFDAFGYYHLASQSSPCINAGDNSAPALPATDIDGNSRIINGVVDIGAVEYNGLLIAKAPADNSVFADLSLINNYQPTFQWIAVEPFKSFEILFSTSATGFSTKGLLIAEGSASGTKSSWTPSIATWKKIMAAGTITPIYWEVVGTGANNSTAESPVRQFSVSSASPPTILSPADGATLPVAQYPTFVFLTNYNIKFRLEISQTMSFTKPTPILAYTYTVTNPNVTPILEETLSSSQWTAVEKLIGTGAGAGLNYTGYFRIRAWDGINRESDSPTQSFIKQH
ncbi:MAG: choice-of-anchor Q domain-containing protein [bacterium]